MNLVILIVILLMIVIVLLVLLLLVLAKRKTNVNNTNDTTLEVKNNNRLKKRILRIIKKPRTKKRKIVYSIVGIFLLICISVGIFIYSQYPTNPDKIITKTMEKWEKDDSFDLENYMDEIYPKDKIFFKEKNEEYRTKFLNLVMQDLSNRYKSLIGNDTSRNLKITGVEITYPYSSGKYLDVNITVKNNGSTDVNYTKINLYFKDKNGKIVKSDWTNDTSKIKPNASQVITKMVESDGWENVSAEIETK